jgi:aminoglycoside phosphotransferase (APT) family kinase protein
MSHGVVGLHPRNAPRPTFPHAELLPERRERAIRAWTSVDPRTSIVDVENLKHGSKGSVFRVHLRPHGITVIGKTGPSQVIAKEAHVLGSILPRFDVPGPTLIATIHEESLGAWMFVEDLGDGASTRPGEDGDEFGRALARVHGVSAGTDTTGLLPERPLRSRLAIAVDAIDRLEHTAQARDGDGLVDGVIGGLRKVIEAWPWMEAVLDQHPTTLTHGDLGQKHVRRSPQGTASFIDWADAAWDAPAVDLFGIGGRDGRAERAYVGAIMPIHPSIGREIASMVRIGRVLRGLQGIGWAMERYESGSQEKALAQLSFFDADIRAALSGRPS